MGGGADGGTGATLLAYLSNSATFEGTQAVGAGEALIYGTQRQNTNPSVFELTSTGGIKINKAGTIDMMASFSAVGEASAPYVQGFITLTPPGGTPEYLVQAFTLSDGVRRGTVAMALKMRIDAAGSELAVFAMPHEILLMGNGIVAPLTIHWMP